MRAAGQVVARVLAATAQFGASRRTAWSIWTSRRPTSSPQPARKPSFLGYHPSWAPTPYPGVLCLSVNDAIVHGIPDGRRLREGDILSIDCGAYVDGLHGDAA